MAKKTIGKKPVTRRTKSLSNLTEAHASTGASASAAREDSRDLGEVVRDIIKNPAVRYVAGGIATAVLTRLANNMAEKYPEISNFIRENLDSVEQKFNFSGSESESARH